MVRRSAWVRTWPGWGLIAVLVTLLAGLLVPAIFQWHVHANAFAPLAAYWRPRFGPGTVPAVAIAAAAWRWAPTLSRQLDWRALLLVTFLGALGWLVALATVDGRSGLGPILQDPNEYLPTARRVGDVSRLLHHFVALFLMQAIRITMSPQWCVFRHRSISTRPVGCDTAGKNEFLNHYFVTIGLGDGLYDTSRARDIDLPHSFQVEYSHANLIENEGQVHHCDCTSFLDQVI